MYCVIFVYSICVYFEVYPRQVIGANQTLVMLCIELRIVEKDDQIKYEIQKLLMVTFYFHFALTTC